MLQLIIKPVRDMYYDVGSNFGIYACEVGEENEDSEKIKYNNYGNFTIKGIMPMLDEKKTYVAKVKEVNDRKYGTGYEVVTIYENRPTSFEEQINFLKAILTENQVREMVNTYPNENIIELIEQDKFDFKKVRGIGKVTYLKIKDKIEKNKHLQEVLVTLQSDYGLTHKMIEKLTEVYRSPKLLLDVVKNNPYILADEVSGIGFKKADYLALQNGISKTSDNRLFACLKFVLRQEANVGHVYIVENDLIGKMVQLLEIKKTIIEAFLKMIKSAENEEVVIVDNKYALKTNYINEKTIAENIGRLQKGSYEMSVPKLEERIQEIEIEQGFDFTGEQREAIFLALENNVVLVNGKAGTGKTSTIKGIVSVLLSADESYTYSTVALSGKASHRIKESTGLDSSTIHRFLGYKKNGFTFNRNNQKELDLLIVDEASMISSKLFASLLEAVGDGCKVVITGDYNQLEPIGAGNVFYDLCRSKDVTKIELTHVHRQAMKSGILSEANQIREGVLTPSLSKPKHQHIGELKDLHYYPYNNEEAVFKKVLGIATAYKKADLDILKFQVITPMKKRGLICTKNLNEELQEIFNPSFSGQTTIKRGQIEFREKDKVIHNGNNYNIGVLNGTIGIIETIDEMNEELIVNFETLGKITMEFADLKDLDLSYALTIHKSQGSQFENCIVAFDNSAYIMLSQQLIYTAITRSINHCYLVCGFEALKRAVRTDKSSRRNTFLLDFLKELQ